MKVNLHNFSFCIALLAMLGPLFEFAYRLTCGSRLIREAIKIPAPNGDVVIDFKKPLLHLSGGLFVFVNGKKLLQATTALEFIKEAEVRENGVQIKIRYNRCFAGCSVWVDNKKITDWPFNNYPRWVEMFSVNMPLSALAIMFLFWVFN